MRYQIPYTWQKYGMIPVDAESLEEAKRKAREWLEGCSVADMDDTSDYLENSEELYEEGFAEDGDGNLLKMLKEIED